MTSQTELQIKKVHCNICGLHTNHQFIASHKATYDEYEDRHPQGEILLFTEVVNAKLWSCMGCDAGVLEEVYSNSALKDQEGKEIYESTFFPKRKAGLKEKKFFIHIAANLKSIYSEIIESFNSGLNTVCAIGLRALIEGICIKEGITDSEAWRLEKKLKQLEGNGTLPKNIIEGLLGLKFMGDDAAHRLEKPGDIELKIGIEIMEDLLNHLYEVKYRLTSQSSSLIRLRNGKKLTEAKGTAD